MRKPTLYTIGYEKSGFSDFVQTLKQARVTRVLDIRELPLSRRAGFSKRQLAAGLEESGIDYDHLRGLGTPKEGRMANKAGRIDEFQNIFDAHMKTKIAKAELQNAATLITREPCCLLCFEADECHCHRLTVANALARLTGMRIEHLHITLI